MTNTTRDAFEAWHNEIEVFATRYERLGELAPKEALFAAWQAATEQGKRQPLTDIDELAKVYASSYASPHHITFTVEGLRNMIEAAHGITPPQGKPS